MPGKPRLTIDEKMARIKPAIEILDRHIFDQKPPGFRDLGRATGIGPATLRWCFIGAIGCTPRRYVLDKRMEVAKQLLEESHLSILQIAQHCGYGHQPTFFPAVVKRYFGCVPRELRKLAKAKQLNEAR